jgi:hypothetical protein
MRPGRRPAPPADAQGQTYRRTARRSSQPKPALVSRLLGICGRLRLPVAGLRTRDRQGEDCA